MEIMNESKKMLFICGVAERYKFMYLISQVIKKRNENIDPYYFISNKKMEKYLLGNEVSPKNIIYLKPQINERINGKKETDLSLLRDIEKKYGIPNLMLFWEGMRVHKVYGLEDSLNVGEGTINLQGRHWNPFKHGI